MRTPYKPPRARLKPLRSARRELYLHAGISVAVLAFFALASFVGVLWALQGQP